MPGLLPLCSVLVRLDSSHISHSMATFTSPVMSAPPKAMACLLYDRAC